METKNKVLNTTSLETKFQVIARPEEKDKNGTYRKGVGVAQSLNANLKKPCIVRTLWWPRTANKKITYFCVINVRLTEV